MKSHQNQRQLKERLNGFKEIGTFTSKCLRSFDLTEDDQNFWSIDTLCSDFDNELLDEDSHKETLSWAMGTLLNSPAARLLMKEAAKDNWMIGVANRDGYDFHVDVTKKQIILHDNNLSASSLRRSDYFRNTMLISLVRALRDIWQEKRHGGFDENYGPEDIIMLERVRAADCEVIGIMVAWELRAEIYGDLWRYIIGSEEGDLAMAFSNYIEKHPAQYVYKDALYAAFKQWFQSTERINSCDHETLEYLDDLIVENGGSNSFGNESLTAETIETLTALPDQNVYLEGKGQDVLDNPLYFGLHEEINHTHLMQILYDMQVINVQGVPFRDAGLAAKIFPDGLITEEE